MMKRNISQKKISTENTVGKQVLSQIAHSFRKKNSPPLPAIVEEKTQEAYRKILNE